LATAIVAKKAIQSLKCSQIKKGLRNG
jgi:hypothetical protein